MADNTNVKGLLGGISLDEIRNGLKAVDTLVQLLQGLPFLSTNGLSKTVLRDIETALKYAENVAQSL